MWLLWLIRHIITIPLLLLLLRRYNQKERRSLLEVLQDFGSAQPPLERLLEAAPLLQPRQFSLASAPAAHGSRAAVLAAVVAWKTPSNRPRKGLITNWLAGLQPCSVTPAAGGGAGRGSGGSVAAGSSGAGGGTVKVPVWIDRGAIRLPPDEGTPLLLVGPGTGVAPFRSFCWHRAATRQQQQQQQQEQQEQLSAAASAEAGAPNSSSSSSNSTLFFGCRSPTADFYFNNEWWPVMQTGALHPQHGFVAAFSRHSPQPSQQELVGMLQHAAAESLLQQRQGSSHASQNSLQQQAADQQQPSPAAAAAVANGNAVGTTSTVSSSSKVYVTHKIREHGAAVWQLLSQQGGWVYVSGSAEKMPAGVVSALEDVAAVHGGLSAEDAARFVRQLELTGRYHVEAWS